MKKTILSIMASFFTLILVGCTGLFPTTIGISIEAPNKTVYILGETFDAAGLKVQSYNSNGDVKDLTADDYTLLNTALKQLGAHTIRVKRDHFEADFTVFVKESPDLIKMVYTTDFPATVFYQTVPTSETLELDGLFLTYLTANFETVDAPLSDFSFNIFDIDVTDSGYTVYAVNISHKTLEGISTTFLIYVG